MGFLQKIFSKHNSTGATNVDKAPLVAANQGFMQMIGNISANYMDVRTRSALTEVFTTISQVYAPIIYSAKAFSNLRIKLYDTTAKEKEITEHELLAKLKSPNPLTNWTDLLKLYYVNLQVQGDAFLYKSTPAGFEKRPDLADFNSINIWNLPSEFVYPVVKPAAFGTSIDDLIYGYSLGKKIGTQVDFAPNEIMHQRLPNLLLTGNNANNITHSLLDGRSPLSTLSEEITNIARALDANNVILRKRGALGVLSSNAKDAVGNVPIPTDERERLQADFQGYGLGDNQHQLILSSYPLSWQSMSWPVKDLMLFEGIKESFKSICNSLNFPILLMNELDGSTFSNLNELKKSFYQDNIIPAGEAFVEMLNSFLGLKERNLLAKADYSHVEVLRQDEKIGAETNQVVTNTITNILTAYKSGTYDKKGAELMLVKFADLSPKDARALTNTQQNEQNTGTTQSGTAEAGTTEAGTTEVEQEGN